MAYAMRSGSRHRRPDDFDDTDVDAGFLQLFDHDRRHAVVGNDHVDAVDIDDWADANCRENIASNGVADRIEPMLGDVRRIAGRHYGFILANINRNILTADMPAYAAALEPGGDLVMSGFLEQDVPAIVACAGELGLRPVATAAREGWMMVHVRKG